MLLLLFVWNSVLGGAQTIVLCVHQEGKTHVELAAKTVWGSKADCTDADTSLGHPKCPPCTDVVLNSAKPELTRTNVLGLATVPLPGVAAQAQPFSAAPEGDATLAPGAHPTRGPPEVEHASEMFRRLIVLRL